MAARIASDERGMTCAKRTNDSAKRSDATTHYGVSRASRRATVLNHSAGRQGSSNGYGDRNASGVTKRRNELSILSVANSPSVLSARFGNRTPCRKPSLESAVYALSVTCASGSPGRSNDSHKYLHCATEGDVECTSTSVRDTTGCCDQAVTRTAVMRGAKTSFGSSTGDVQMEQRRKKYVDAVPHNCQLAGETNSYSLVAGLLDTMVPLRSPDAGMDSPPQISSHTPPVRNGKKITVAAPINHEQLFVRQESVYQRLAAVRVRLRTCASDTSPLPNSTGTSYSKLTRRINLSSSEEASRHEKSYGGSTPNSGNFRSFNKGGHNTSKASHEPEQLRLNCSTESSPLGAAAVVRLPNGNVPPPAVGDGDATCIRASSTSTRPTVRGHDSDRRVGNRRHDHRSRLLRSATTMTALASRRSVDDPSLVARKAPALAEKPEDRRVRPTPALAVGRPSRKDRNESRDFLRAGYAPSMGIAKGYTPSVTALHEPKRDERSRTVPAAASSALRRWTALRKASTSCGGGDGLTHPDAGSPCAAADAAQEPVIQVPVLVPFRRDTDRLRFGAGAPLAVSTDGGVSAPLQRSLDVAFHSRKEVAIDHESPPISSAAPMPTDATCVAEATVHAAPSSTLWQPFKKSPVDVGVPSSSTGSCGSSVVFPPGVSTCESTDECIKAQAQPQPNGPAEMSSSAGAVPEEAVVALPGGALTSKVRASSAIASDTVPPSNGLANSKRRRSSAAKCLHADRDGDDKHSVPEPVRSTGNVLPCVSKASDELGHYPQKVVGEMLKSGDRGTSATTSVSITGSGGQRSAKQNDAHLPYVSAAQPLSSIRVDEVEALENIVDSLLRFYDSKTVGTGLARPPPITGPLDVEGQRKPMMECSRPQMSGSREEDKAMRLSPNMHDSWVSDSFDEEFVWDRSVLWCGEEDDICPSLPPPLSVPRMDFSMLIIPNDEDALFRYRIPMPTATEHPREARAHLLASLGVSDRWPETRKQQGVSGDTDSANPDSSLNGGYAPDLDRGLGCSRDTGTAILREAPTLPPSSSCPCNRKEDECSSSSPEGDTAGCLRHEGHMHFTDESDALDGGRGADRERRVRERDGRVQMLLLGCQEQRGRKALMDERNETVTQLVAAVVCRLSAPVESQLSAKDAK